MRRYESIHGHPIIITEGLRDRPIVAVELYPKWYGLQLIHPLGRVEEIPFPTLEGRSPCYVDHCPHPRVVADWALQQRYTVDELSYELMVGRWLCEHSDDW